MEKLTKQKFERRTLEVRPSDRPVSRGGRRYGRDRGETKAYTYTPPKRQAEDPLFDHPYVESGSASWAGSSPKKAEAPRSSLSGFSSRRGESGKHVCSLLGGGSRRG